jgi:hypothetical protein
VLLVLSLIYPEKHSGKDTVYDPSNHPSLKEIKKQNDCTKNIVFEKVTTDKVEKIINNINTKKATGAVDHYFYRKVLLVLSLIYPEKHSDLLTYLKYL